MNEQLQAKLVEILAGIQAATKTAGDFAMEQLPDIAQQYLAYGRMYETLFAAFAALVFCLGFVAVHRLRRKLRAADAEFDAALADYNERKSKTKDGYFYDSRPHRGSYFDASKVGPLTYAPFAIGSVLFMLNLSSLLLVWFAPKVWLLKELASLIK